ncbi:MAG: hypothetical protein HGA33_01825 [Candidatus Moranbacteria bacterium]|nr:hypothetical protein [Candidatus Moranbacteria bacterium]
MDTIRFFVGFYIEATKKCFFDRRILTYAVIGAIFGIGMPGLFQEGAPLHAYADLILKFLSVNPAFFLIVPIGLLISLFSSAALSLSFGAPPISFTRSMLTAVRRLPRLIALKAAFLASSAAALALLSIPGIIAAAFSSPLAPLLLLGGFLIFMPVFVILAFTESFAFFHILFSKTRMLSSIQLGYSLVSRNTSGIAGFATLSLFIILSVTTVLESVTRIADILISDSVGKAISVSLIFLIVQAAYSAIRTGAWFGYFTFLSSGPALENTASSQEEEKMIQKEVAEVS